MKKTLLISAILLFLSLALRAQVYELKDNWWVPNGIVNAIVKDNINEKVYIGGEFTQIGPSEPYGTSLSISTGIPNFSYLNPNGYVYTCIPDGKGGWYVGGNFTMIGSSIRNYLAQLDSNGQVTSWNPDMNASVTTLLLSGTTLYAGGYFTSIGGVNRNYIGAINSATGVATSWNPDASNPVSTLALYGSIVYAGGWFTTMGGQSRNYIAAINTGGAGTLNSWNPGANDEVKKIAIIASNMYVGGRFTAIGGQNRNYIAKLDVSTATVSSWNPNASSTVTDIIVTSSSVFTSGYFTTIGGQNRNYLAALSPSTGIASSWNPSASNPVNSIVLKNNIIYAGGYFLTVGSQARNYLAAIDATSGVPTSWNPMVSNPVNALAIFGSNVYAGGEFSCIGGVLRNNLVCLDFYTGTATNWDPNSDSFIRTLALKGNTLYAGGDFTQIGGQNRNKIAAIDINTGSSTAWNPNSNNLVRTIIVDSTKVFVGGDFTNIGGQSRNRIASIDISTGAANSWNPNANNIVSTIAVSGGSVFIGGAFTVVGGQTRNRIAAIDATTGNITSWNPDADGAVKSLFANDNEIFAGGVFSSIGGQSRNALAAISTITGTATGWVPNVNGSVDVIDININRNLVFIGGVFTTVNGSIRNRGAALDINSAALNSWNPNANSAINCIEATDNAIFTGGIFSSISGIAQNYFASYISSKGVYGNIFIDYNENCLKNFNETGLAYRRAIINPGNIVVEANSVGNWQIDSLPPGNYSILYDTTGKWKPTCTTNQGFTVNNYSSTVLKPFGMISTEFCAEPQISVNMSIIRPGFSNQNIYIQACNEYYATGALVNGYIELELDPLIIPQSATVSYTNLGNNIYKFILPNSSLIPGQCESIMVSCSLSTSAVVNSTLCLKANLYPADSCVFDTIKNIATGVSPCTLPWDKSSLKVTGKCTGDSIRFVVYNHGSGSMQCYAPVRIYVDGVLISLDSIMLVSGDSAVYTFLGDGKTWRLEADQHPLHPGNSHPNATVENCNPGAWTPGLVTILPQDDADGVVDIYCGVVTGSIDPNDKTGYPLGVGTSHDVMPNQQLEYVIRFQNTGTDTAFTVVIRDTLDTDLDIFSVVSGVSSHKYKFRMYGKRVLEWTFNNILLPDSNVNEAASHGFVTFTLEQNRNLANGTEITNTAGIYFDFNAPVITNTTVHTVNEEVQSVVSSQKLVGSKQSAVGKLVVYPNPATGQITVSSSSFVAISASVEIWNGIGVVVKNIPLPPSKGDYSAVIDISDLPRGMYVVKCGVEAVKLVIE